MGMRGDGDRCRKRSPPLGVGSIVVVPVDALGLSGMWHTSAITVAVCVRLRGCACIPYCAVACVLRHRSARDSI